MSIAAALESIKDAPIIAPVPGGDTHELRLVKLTSGVSQKGNTYITALIELPEEPTAQTLREFVGTVPEAGDNSAMACRARSDVRKFMEGFDLDFEAVAEELESQNESPSAVGATAQAVIGLRKSTRRNADTGEREETGQEENYIIAYV